MRVTADPGQIHVWTVDLLDAGWDRLAKFIFESPSLAEPVPRTIESRRAHAALNCLLHGYLGSDVDRCVVRRRPGGRPELVDSTVSFNLTHSRGLALIAFSVAPVGVDLEFIDRSSGDPDELVDAVLHPREARAWRNDLEGDRWDRLHRVWVGKEAYAKALGVGLARDFRSFRIEIDRAGMLRVIDENGPGESRMYVHELTAPTGFAAAVCTPIVEPWIKRRGLSPQEASRWT